MAPLNYDFVQIFLSVDIPFLLNFQRAGKFGILKNLNSMGQVGSCGQLKHSCSYSKCKKVNPAAR